MTIQEIFEIWAIVMFMILMTGLVVTLIWLLADAIKRSKE